MREDRCCVCDGHFTDSRMSSERDDWSRMEPSWNGMWTIQCGGSGRCMKREAASPSVKVHTHSSPAGDTSDNTYLGPMFSGPAVSKEVVSDDEPLLVWGPVVQEGGAKCGLVVMETEGGVGGSTPCCACCHWDNERHSG